MIFARRFVCQSGRQLGRPLGSVCQSSRTSIDDGVRWNTYSSLAARAEVGDDLHGAGAGADDPDDLVAEVLEVPAR